MNEPPRFSIVTQIYDTDTGMYLSIDGIANYLNERAIYIKGQNQIIAKLRKQIEEMESKTK